MAKFKRVNISALAWKNCQQYFVFDLLKQTTVKQFCEKLSYSHAEHLKKIILNQVKKLLDLMIVDEKPKGVNDVRSQIQS